MNAKVCVTMLIGLSMLLISVTDQASAESIGIFTQQQKIEKTDDVFVTGFVDAESSYIPIRLEVYDPNDNLIFRPDVRVNDNGQFSWLFHPPLGKFATTGTYTIIASHEELSDTAIVQFTVMEDASISNTWLEDIKSERLDDSKQSSKFTGDITQDGTTSTERSLQGDNPGDDQRTPTEQMISPENTSNQTNGLNAESPIVITAIALSIAGIISGIVIWTRTTYQKQIIER